MGMDVYGKNPTAEAGQYFRANVWYWHPLWQYCEDLHPNLASKVEHAHSNDGDGLKSVDARNLGRLILKDIDSGKAQKYIDDFDEYKSQAPEDDCDFCDDNGMIMIPTIHEDPVVCGSCKGTKKREAFIKHYYLHIDVLKDFANFLIDSGGFEIW